LRVLCQAKILRENCDGSANSSQSDGQKAPIAAPTILLCPARGGK
jgi:hypothetical protein